MAFRWTAWGVTLLLGCGGRAESDGLTQPPEGGAPATAGAPAGTGAGSGQPLSGAAHGGASGAGGASDGVALGGGATTVVFDDERPPSGAPAPPPPVPSAIFWGSPSSGWKIGNWFSYLDTVRDVGLTPLEPPRGDSKQARRISGTGVPGGVLWLELIHPQRWAVDLAPYAGIRFWARLTSPSGELGVLLNDGMTAPETWRTVSPPSALTLVLGREWQEVTLPFETFGEPPAKAVSIDFWARADGESFELWIDDLAFYCAAACP